MKTLWRMIFLAAVSLGGVSLVKAAVELRSRENKKYIEL